jgi:hypothetical protein
LRFNRLRAGIRLLRNDRGAALVIVLGVLFALSLIALASFEAAESEKTIVGNKAKRTQAFLAAEAGMARADYVLSQNPYQTSADTLTGLINSDTLLPNARFRLAMDSTLPRRKVIALGFAGEAQSGIQVQYEHGRNRRSIWNNALFAGHGNDGRTLSGTLEIHGSVHVLGDGEPFVDANSNGVWDAGESYTDVNHDSSYDAPTDPDSLALDLSSGASYLSNNYAGLHGMFVPRLPALPTASYGGESVATLGAELRVDHGEVALSGGADIGQANSPGGSPAHKETFDATFVSDGYAGDPNASVYSDNGHANPYDFADNPPDMPDLDAQYTDPFGTNYPSYMAYLKANALVVSDSLVLRLGTPIPLMSSGHGSLYMDAAGNIQASGIIYVEGDFKIADGPGDFLYDGRFTIVSEGDMVLDEDLMSKQTFATNDVAGLISHGDIRIGTVTNEDPEFNAAIFAQEEIHVITRTAHVAGAMVSNHVRADYPLQIYEVPALAENLPPGMPGTKGIPPVAWRKVPRSWVELE